MFSSMTMASSTTKPIASTRASSVNVLMLKPAIAIIAKVPIKAAGMVTNGMMDARRVRRNTKITSATSTEASTMVWNTALMERSMNTELSLATSICTPGGKSLRSLSSSLTTPADNSSGLATACLMTPTPTASRPLRRTVERSSSGAWRTRATSPMRMLCPLTVRITTWENSRGVCKSVAAVTLNSRWLLSMRPAGTSRLLRRKASSRSCTVSL